MLVVLSKKREKHDFYFRSSDTTTQRLPLKKRREKNPQIILLHIISIWPFFPSLFREKKVNVLHFNYRRYIKKWGLIKGKSRRTIYFTNFQEKEKNVDDKIWAKQLPIFAFQIIFIVLSLPFLTCWNHGCVFWPGSQSYQTFFVVKQIFFLLFFCY